jgi:hypothetical protein
VQSQKQLKLTYAEAVTMWVTGSPPMRLQHTGKENVQDVLQDMEEESREARDAAMGKSVHDAPLGAAV